MKKFKLPMVFLSTIAISLIVSAASAEEPITNTFSDLPKTTHDGRFSTKCHA